VHPLHAGRNLCPLCSVRSKACARRCAFESVCPYALYAGARQRLLEGKRLNAFARSVRGCLALRGVAQEFEADRWLICVQVSEMFRGLVSLLPSSSAAILVFVYRPRGGDAELWEIARDLGAL